MRDRAPRDARGDSPAVSVVVPAYRASHDIRAALDSVFNQTWTDFEVIVVNDGSPDTAHLKREIEAFGGRIRYLERPHRGPGAARNAAIVESTARYVAFLDSDDCWTEDFLQRQVGFLERNTLCELVYCDAVLSGDSPAAGRRFMEEAPSEGRVSLEALLAGRCSIPLSTVVVRRNRLVRGNLFDEDLRAGEEFEWALRLALRGATMRFQPVVLAEVWTDARGRFGDRLVEIERTLNVLEHFGRAHVLPVAPRTTLRVRAMTLMERLEIEQAKRRVVEGNFAAAKYHLTASRRRTIPLRAALLALRIAPRVARRLYLAYA